jgi:MFS family permease
LAATLGSQKYTLKDPFFYKPLGAEITYQDFLTNRHACWLLIILTFAFVCQIYIEPTIGVQLVNLGVIKADIGLAFGAVGIGFGVGGYVAGHVCDHLPNDKVILGGLIGTALGMALEGPLFMD